LKPDIVLAAREENTRRRIERIAEYVPVLLTDVRSPLDVPRLWRELGNVCGREEAAEARAHEVENELMRAGTSNAERAPRFVYWIWRDPWMAAGHATYISALLTAAGWQNALPAERQRYPKVDPGEMAAFGAVTMMFSSEPFDFELPRDLDPFPGPAVFDKALWRCADGATALRVDGQRFSWYPSLTAEGLRSAAELRARLTG
jgi:ABC-type Fe3+-hydroxamate transport system substrate-binding protein